MAALTFIPYTLPHSGSKKFSADGFRSIDDFGQPHDEPAKSASQSMDRPGIQQGAKRGSKVRNRTSPAEFKDPYRNMPEDLAKWCREGSVSDSTDFIKRKGHSSSTAQDRGDCKDNPFVVENDCLDGSPGRGLEEKEPPPYCKSAEDTPDSQVNAIDPVSPIDSRMQQSFYGTADLENIFRAGANNEASAEYGVSKDRTEIELEIQDTLGTKRKAGCSSSYNQGNTAFFDDTSKNDSDDVNNNFRAQDKSNTRDKSTVESDKKGEKLLTKRRRLASRERYKARNSFSESEATGNSFRGNPLLLGDEEDDDCNTDESSNRNSNQDGGQKSQSPKKRRKVLRSKGSGEACDNRGRASVVRRGIQDCASVVGGELEDTNEAPNAHVLEEAEDNSLEAEADTTVSGGQKWKIKKIRDKRFVRVGKGEMRMQYRVQWGHSWVDAEDIEAPKLIRDFEAAQRPKPSRPSQAVHAVGRGKGQGRGRGRGRPSKNRSV